MASPENSLPKATPIWPYLALALGVPVALIAAFVGTLRGDPFAIFDSGYIALVIIGLPLLAMAITLILAVLMPGKKRAPILTALWIFAAGFMHFWVWVQVAASV